MKEVKRLSIADLNCSGVISPFMSSANATQVS